MMVVQLNRFLPAEYAAEPRVHLGSNFEVNVWAFEREEMAPGEGRNPPGHSEATATYAPPEPTMVADLELTEPYEYEVLVFDRSRGRELVAAVEIVSPANKDRPESRQAFVAKCAARLQKRVCVSIVDLVTTRKFNLYGELMEMAGRPVPEFVATAAATYAATCRGRRVNDRPRFEVWAYPLVVGQPLPTLPIWVREDRSIGLDLEASYEETCRALRLG
jgi:hypothetical protein